jgi:3-oxoadipate enol-lactonase
LILLDTRATADTDEQRKARYDTIEQVKREGVAPVVASMLPKMFTKNAPPELVDEVRAIMSGSSPEGVIAALDAMARRPDSTDLLPTLTIPVLILVGEEDPITPPSDSEKMAAAIPNATLARIPNAAHLANVEQASEVNRVVEGWLAGVG